MSYNKEVIMKIFVGGLIFVCSVAVLPHGLASAADYTVGDVELGDVDITIGGQPERSMINDTANDFWFKGGYELGFIDVLSHTVQFGSDGTQFDYVEEGKQNILFPFQRLSGEIHFGPRHAFIFLYQPLDIRTEALLTRDVIVDELTFPADTPVELRYGFDFYRLSYLYDFSRRKDREIAIGLSLQLRNASIWFKSADGSLFRINQDVGPVPIFKFRGQMPLNTGMWIGTEIDGFYASGRYITGSDNDFEGAILDASLRLGFELNKSFAAFCNVRYIGGGASGIDEGDTGPGDGYTDNWLHTVAVTLGMYVK
jgi:hypothetical protein